MTNNKTPLFYYLGSAPVLSLLLLVAATAHCRAAGHKRKQRHTPLTRPGAMVKMGGFGIICVSNIWYIIYLCLYSLYSLNGFKESVYYFPWLSQVCSDQQQLCFIVIIGAAAPLLLLLHWTLDTKLQFHKWSLISDTKYEAGRGKCSQYSLNIWSPISPHKQQGHHGWVSPHLAHSGWLCGSSGHMSRSGVTL